MHILGAFVEATVRSILAGFALLLLVGCSSAPELQKYSRAEIDRPYTLPEHVATWTTWAPFGYFQDAASSVGFPPIPVPLFWQTALSDSWQLNWGPLPLGISHQLVNAEDRVSGVSFGMGVGYGSALGFTFYPHTSFYFRQKLSKQVAFEFVPNGDATLYTGSGTNVWALGLDMGPLFQLTPSFALRLRASLNLSTGSIYSIVQTRVQPPSTTRVTLPLSVSTVWSITRQWDLGLSYTYSGIGYTNYQGHLGALKATHYW